MTQVSTLLVDDQPLLRAGFRMILEAQADIRVVGEAADGRAAVEQAAALGPDVVLMDLRMPVLDGIEATRRIVGAGHGRVLVLTTFDIDGYVLDALHAGAAGFLLKDTSPENLCEAVRAVAAGQAALGPSAARQLLDYAVTAAGPFPAGTTLRADRDPRRAAAELARLTPRERDVLGLMALGLSNGEIATRLVLGDATVKTHVGNVFTKLGVRDRVQAVVWAYSHRAVPACRPDPTAAGPRNHGAGMR